MGFKLISGRSLFSKKVDRPELSKYRVVAGGLSNPGSSLTTVTPETVNPVSPQPAPVEKTIPDNRKYGETLSEYKPTKPTFKKKVADVFEIAKNLLTNQPTTPEERLGQAKEIYYIAKENNLPMEVAAKQFHEGLMKSIPRLVKIAHLNKKNSDLGRNVMIGAMHPDAAIDKSNKILQEQSQYVSDPEIQKYRNKDRIIRKSLELAAGNTEYLVNAQLTGVVPGLASAGVGYLRGGKPGAAAGYLAGSKVGVIAYTAGQEGGSMMMDLLHNGVDVKIARPISIIGGIISGMIESTQEAKIFKGLPMGDKMTAVLGNPGMKKTFMRVLKSLGKDYPVEVMEEVQQYLTTEGGKSLAELLNSLSTGGEYKGQTLGNIASGALEEGKQAALALAPLQIGGGAVQTIQQNRLNQQEDRKAFGRMQEAARVDAIRAPIQPRSYKVISGEELGLPQPKSNLGPVTGDLGVQDTKPSYKVVSGEEVNDKGEVVYPQGQADPFIQEAISKPLTLVLLEPSELNDYNYKVGDDFILEVNGDRDPVKVTKVKDGKIVEVVTTDTGEVLIKDGKVLSRTEIRAENDARAEQAQDPLIAEAKKYRSADEFVESEYLPQSKQKTRPTYNEDTGNVEYVDDPMFETGKSVKLKVFHGSRTDIIEFNEKARGSSTKAPSAKEATFFTEDAETAKQYAFSAPLIEQKGLDPATRMGTPKAREFFIELKNPFVKDYKGEGYRDESYVSIIKQAKKKGYDGVIFKNTKDPGQGSVEDANRINVYAVFDNNAIKTKAQLTDIWNKAQKNVPRAGGLPIEAPEYVKKALEKGVTVQAREHAIKMDEAVEVKDIHGNKVSLTKGHEFTPFVLSNGKVWLHDGKNIVINKSALTNIKQSPATTVLEGFYNKEEKGVSTVVKGKKVPESKITKLMAADDITREKAIELIKAQGGEEEDTKFSRYLPVKGGDNYQEVLVTVPDESKQATKKDYDDFTSFLSDKYQKNGQLGFRVEELTDYEKEHLFSLSKAQKEKKHYFQSGHFSEPNIVVHIRKSDFTTPDGKRVLQVQEIQSDWDKAGRDRGFKDPNHDRNGERFEEISRLKEELSKDRDPVTNRMKNEAEWHRLSREQESISGKNIKQDNAVPYNPILSQWKELGVKKALQMAVEGGYDYLALPTGEQTAELYDLSKKIEEIQYYYSKSDKAGTLKAYDRGSNEVIKEIGVRPEKLADYIGKEPASKITNQLDKDGDYLNIRLPNQDLVVGGEWANQLYDKKIPSILKKLTGADIEQIELGKLGFVNKRYIGKSYNFEELRDLAEEAPNQKVQNQLYNLATQMEEYGEPMDRLASKYLSDESAEYIGGRLETRKEAMSQPAIRITPKVRSRVISAPMAGGLPMNRGTSLGEEFDEVYTPLKLEGEEAKLQDRGAKYARDNIEKIIAEYKKDNPKPQLVSTDKFRWLFKPAGFNGANSNAFHEPASAVKKIYEKSIIQQALKDDKPDALLMAGGSGSGKSTIQERMEGGNEAYGYILDSNLANPKKAVDLIESLKKQGLAPQLLYVHRDPVSAWNGVLKRIIGGSDPRVVPLNEHIKLHLGSLETAKLVAEKYGNSKLETVLVDNSGKPGQEQEMSLDELKKISYNKDDLREVLEDETIKQYQKETINQEFAEAALERKLTQSEISGRSKGFGSSPQQTKNISRSEQPVESKLRDTNRKPFSQKGVTVPPSQEVGESQLQLFPTERKAAHGTKAQRDANYAKAIDDIRKARDSVKPKPLTNSQRKAQIADELAKRGFIDYRGVKITDYRDLAELAAAFRNPRIEQLQLFLLKDGKIVAHRVLTSGKVNAAAFGKSQLLHLKKTIDRTGADTIYFAHNHPGGSPVPSHADVSFTKSLNNQLDDKVQGHLVMDGAEYSIIKKSSTGKFSTYTREYKEPRQDFNFSNIRIKTEDDLITEAKKVFRDDRICVVYHNSNLYVEGIEFYHMGVDLNRAISDGKKYHNSPSYSLIIPESHTTPKLTLPRGILSYLKKQGDTFVDVGEEAIYYKKITLSREPKTKPAWSVQEKQKETVDQARARAEAVAREALATRPTMQDIVDAGPGVPLDTKRSVPLESDESAVIAQFEKVKDLWLGGKDSRVHGSKVELRKFQTAIKEALGLKRFDDEAKRYDAAIKIYIDTKRNPAHIEQFKDKLTPDQLSLLELSQNLPESIKAIAAQIQESSDALGKEAYDMEIIKNVLDNHQNRIWDFDNATVAKHRKFGTTTKHALPRRLETIIEGWAKGYTLKVTGATGSLQILKEELVKTIEDKRFIKALKQLKNVDGSPILTTRYFPGAVRIEHPNFKQWSWIGLTPKPEVEEIKKTEGPKDNVRTIKQYVKNIGVDPKQMAGYSPVDFKEFGLSSVLRADGFPLDVIAADLIEAGELTAFEGENPTDTLVEAMQTNALLNSRADEYKPDQAKLFSRRVFRAMSGDMFERKELYAPKYVADNLNNILGVSKLKGVWKVGGVSVIDKVTKYNTIMKGWRLLTSFFHHLAYMRSYYLGTNNKKWGDMSIRQAYKAGLKAADDCNPILELGVQEGLTLGLKQDWNEDLMRETNVIREFMKKNKYSAQIQNVILDLRERQTNFLFGEFGAGLKAKSFLIEYANLMRKHPDLDPRRAARLVANLINDDFGGLNLARLDRDPTLQHIFRLFCLAPDWTESNIRSMVKAIRTGDKVEQEMYRHFWAGILAKAFVITTVANLLLNRAQAGEAEKKAWEEGKFRWMDADITNLYRLLGGKSPARKYFSVLGHFKDPIKFVMRNERNRSGKISFQPGNLRAFKHKGSVVAGLFLDFMSGTDWSGRRFTTVQELLGIDKDKGYYKTTRKGYYKKGDPKYGKLRGRSIASAYTGRTGILEAEQLPSFILAQIKGGQPVPIQKLMAWWCGELEGFDAISQAAGLRVSTTYPRSEDMEIDKEKFPNISAGYNVIQPKKKNPFSSTGFKRREPITSRTLNKRTFKKRSYR